MSQNNMFPTYPASGVASYYGDGPAASDMNWNPNASGDQEQQQGGMMYPEDHQHLLSFDMSWPSLPVNRPSGRTAAEAVAGGVEHRVASGVSSLDVFPMLASAASDLYIQRKMTDTMGQVEDPRVASPMAGVMGLTPASATQLSLEDFKQPLQFTLREEDFPALPNTTEGPDEASAIGAPTGNMRSAELPFSIRRMLAEAGHYDAETFPTLHSTPSGGSQDGASGDDLTTSSPAFTERPKPDIRVTPDGMVTGIPGSMMKNQFGMAGLVPFMRGAITHPSQLLLTQGVDLTQMGLNMNSPDPLLPTFTSALGQGRCPPQFIECDGPNPYRINSTVGHRLPPIRFDRYKDDQIFSIFYFFPGDTMQMAAATELYDRGWRYHMTRKVWLTRVPGVVPTERTATHERGAFSFFDRKSWKEVQREILLKYDSLEGRPLLHPDAGAFHPP